MRIDLMEFLPVTLQRKETFTIARSSSAISEAIFLGVHSGKRTGHGVAVPTDVTRENVHSVLNTLQGFARTFGGVEFEKPFQLQERMDKLAANQPSARAAVEMALFDLSAQAAGMPLYADVERVKAIRDAVGKDIELRVDGNQGYSWSDALSFARNARNEGVAFFEQPVSVNDWEGMRALTESSPIPIMADEMVLTPDDVKKLRWSNAARAVNMKLMKHGGILRSMEVNTLCEAAGYPTMVGCMGEPQLSVAAGLHFALAQKNVHWLDLDSHFKFSSDPTSGLRFDKGELVAPSKPGLGIDVKFPT